MVIPAAFKLLTVVWKSQYINLQSVWRDGSLYSQVLSLGTRKFLEIYFHCYIAQNLFTFVINQLLMLKRLEAVLNI
jgi:hypothetical protein